MLFAHCQHHRESRIMLWSVFKEVYLQLLETRYPNSDHAAQVRRVLERFTRYRNLQERTLTEITQTDLESYLLRRREDLNPRTGEPLSERTINNEIKILNSAFYKSGPRASSGAGRGNLNLIENPPWLAPIPEYHREPAIIDEHQLERLIAATDSARCPRVPGVSPPQFWRAAILLDLVTLLRRRALLRIPRPDDHTLLERLEIVLPAELNKTRKTLRLSLGSRAVASVLAELPTARGEPLLPWKRRTAAGRWLPMSLAYFSNEMKRLQELAGITGSERVRLKDLRSTGGTRIADLYGDAIAKKQLGHSPHTNTIQTNYKSYAPTALNRDAAESMAEMLLPFLDLKPELRVHSAG